MIVALLLALQVSAPAPAGQITPPRQIYMPPIASYYPPEAMARDEQGTTRLKCVLDATGRLVDCALHSSSGSATLDTAAFRIAQDARYEPQRVDGTPVAIPAILPVRWVLAD
jgi:protein TonB